MPTSSNFRFLLATIVLWLLFATAFEAAVRWPSQPMQSSLRTYEAAPTDSLAVGAPSPDALVHPPPPTPPTTPEETEELLHRDPRPVFERGNWWARRPRLFHRYVGTVGGQPATALLEWQNPDSVSGSFYLHRQGPAYNLTQPRPPAPAARPIRRWGRGSSS